MTESDSHDREETLNTILKSLQSGDADHRLQAISDLETINFSSEAIRSQLEKLALHDQDRAVRDQALAALNLTTNQYVASKSSSIPKYDRNLIMDEIEKWEKDNLIESSQAETIKRRYNFDIVKGTSVKPQPAEPGPAPVQPAVPAPQPKPTPAASTEKRESAAIKTPAPQPKPEPAAPRPTLLQTLLSETSIKIYLYLGAFFVIASAVILGALVEAARLPILVVGTFFFGAAAVGIRKRLPQPGFALFIVFSFLLPITANVIGQSLNFSFLAGAIYWTIVYLIMAIIWSGSTWLYESRLFSVAAFISLTLALVRLGDIINAKAEFYTTMAGLAALAGIGGVWVLKKWRDFKFTLPLFLSAQLVQIAVLMGTVSIFFVRLFDADTQALWHLSSVFTLGLAFGFFLISESILPFFIFPWFASGTLILMPWFMIAASGQELFGNNIISTVMFSIWGLILSVASEVIHRMMSARKYSLPILFASIPTFACAVIAGFVLGGPLETTQYGLMTALGVAIVYGVLHFTRPRGWLWALALFNFIVAYFAFFNLPFMEQADVFPGYQLLGLSLLFLLPDLFLKNDLKASLAWRLPPRIYGAFFTLWIFLGYSFAQNENPINIAVIFGVSAAFLAFYSVRYQQPWIGYLSALAVVIAVLYTLDHLDLKSWFEALSVLAVIYYLMGYYLRKNDTLAGWRTMLAISGLTLGSIISLIALSSAKEHSGWWVAIMGALFVVEMYNRRQGLLEAGAQILIPAATFLVLNDFKLNSLIYILLGLSISWLGLDMIFSRTFKGKRLLEWPVRITGAFIAAGAALALFTDNDPAKSALCFGIYTVFFSIYTIVQRKAVFGYIPAAYLPVTIFFTLDHFNIDAWLPALTGLAVFYLLIGFAIRARTDWSFMSRNSALALGSMISIGTVISAKDTDGWYLAVIGVLFIVEMYVRKQGLFEFGPQLLFPAAVFLILRDFFKMSDLVYTLLGLSLTWLSLDLIFSRTYKEKRWIAWPVRITGALFALLTSFALIGENDPDRAAICFAIFTVFFTICTLVQRKADYGYIPAAYLPLTVYFAIEHFKVDAWLPTLSGLVILYFLTGFAIRAKRGWSFMLRNSALALGTAISFGALFALKEMGGWYALITGLLFAAEMHLRRNGWFEVGLPAMFTIGSFLILRDFEIVEPTYHLLAYSLVWLLSDLLAHLTFTQPRNLKWLMRGIGAFLTLINYGILFINGMAGDSRPASIGFGVYSLLFLTVSLLYRQPNLLYTFTISLPFFAAFLFREFDLTKWIHPVIGIAAVYYAVGYYLRRVNRASGWDSPLLFSGLGLGVIVSVAAPILGGLDAAIPVALAATLWAVEAFARKNPWLGFPANALYLLAYFIILLELKQDEPQFFSMGAALLGLIQHYLLTRAGNKTAAFLTGMVSQLVLLGTTYIQMLNTAQLSYFIVLFFQSIAVLVYGIVIRSRSLTFTPIALVVLGVVTVIYSALKGISTVVLIGCTGIILLLVGVLAVLMRERITKLGERLSTWQA